METIFPPFTALLRRWRPLLSGTHELTDADGQSPLSVEDRSIDSNTLPLEVCHVLYSIDQFVSSLSLFYICIKSPKGRCVQQSSLWWIITARHLST